MNDQQKRMAKLVLDAAAKLGSQQAVADYLGVTRSTVTEYVKGRADMPGAKLIRLQDLLKRAACVLLTWATLASPDPAQAALNLAPLVRSISPNALTEYTLRRIRAWLAMIGLFRLGNAT